MTAIDQWWQTVRGTGAGGWRDIRRIRLLMTVTTLPVVVVAAFLLERFVPVDTWFWWALAAGVAGAGASVLLAGRWWMDQLIGPYQAVTIALMVAGSGGAASPLSPLFLLLLLFGALTYPTNALVVTTVLAALGMFLPLLYDDGATAVEGVLLLLLLFVSVVSAVLVRGQAHGRRRHAERVHEQEQRFRAITDTAVDGVFRIDAAPPYRVEYSNAEMARLLEEATGRSIDPTGHDLADLVPDADGLVDRVERSTREPVEVAVGDGADRRWLTMRATRDVALGGATSFHGIVRDVTRAKREEQALRSALEHQEEATAELARVNAVQRTFLSAVSHELRTPLTVILGLSETLARFGEQLEPARRHDLTARVQHNAQRLQRLLSDLLDVDRLSRDALMLNRQPSDVSRLVTDVIEGLTIAATHEVTTHVPEGLEATIDAPKISRVVENLIINALKHTPPGTTIDVAAQADGDRIVLRVADDGPGIPESLHAAVFDPFVQGDASGSDASPGTGVGLALVRDLTELHEGTVELSDRAEGGAVFTITLPQAQPVTSGSAAVEPSTPDP